MWIVRLALERPYTFIVMAILIAILGVMSALNTPTDVFPYINIPVAGVIWSYSGISPDDMAKRVLLISERAMTTTVNSIEHIEATSYNGVGLIRHVGAWRLSAEVVMARQPEVFVRALEPAEAQRPDHRSDRSSCTGSFHA